MALNVKCLASSLAFAIFAIAFLGLIQAGAEMANASAASHVAPIYGSAMLERGDEAF